MKRAFVILFFLAVITCGLPSLLYAQTTGTALGYVKDSTGAVVPGALITITDSSTGFYRKATTDEEGYYSVPNLPVATYTVTATRQGFKTFIQRDVRVDVARNVRVDINLEVGQVSEIVDVAAATEKVETNVATL